MSAVAVRSALQEALVDITPTIGFAWENVKYSPVPGTPYARVTVLLAEPANAEVGAGARTYYTEQGFMQVDLRYPLGNGPTAALTRAEAIRSTFYRGASFTASGVTAHIERTPEIMPGRVEDDRFVIPVRSRFYAHIRGA